MGIVFNAADLCPSMIFIQSVSRIQLKFKGKHIYTALKLQRFVIRPASPTIFPREESWTAMLKFADI